MKKPILFIVLILTAVNMFAQRPYCCITPGAELEYSIIDTKGNVTAGSKSTVISATGSNGNYDIVMTVETAGLAPMEVATKIRGGNASVNVGGIAIDVDGKVPFIPSKLAVGMELDCGTVTVDVSGIRTTQNIHSNRVIGREELSTDAGTFKCYIVEQVYDAVAFGFKVKGTQKTWYARGVGMVKLETYDAKGKLIQTQVLTSYHQ